jgi:hexosaminidase
LCAGNEKVYKFIDDVIGELVTIFPSEKFHVGGDEAPLTNWKKCPKCQNTVKGNDLKDMHGLMSYFFNRVNQSLVKYKKRPMFWYEYDVPNYPSNSFMYAWRGEIRDTLIQRMVDEGHQVICTPGIHTYFDYPQLKGEETCHWMPILNLERVYQFDPGYGLSSKYQKRIYGVEGTLWGEYIKDINRAFYMTWPRAMALSEAGWSEMDNRSWDSFKKRLYPQLERLIKWGINFRVPTEIGNSPMNK